MTRKGLSRRTGAERSQCSGSGHWRGLTGGVLSGGLLSPPTVQQVEFDSGGGRNPAMTCRSGFFSIAAIHFHARSEAVIDPRVLRFSAWPAGLRTKAVTSGTKTEVGRAAAF